MKITLIGTGNVAYHLGLRFRENDAILNQIVGRNEDKIRAFSIVFQTDATTDFSKIKTDSDIYIIAVNDSAIETVAQKLSQVLDNLPTGQAGQLVAHTSGSIPSSILAPYFKNYGSLYPLQTFSVSSFVDFDSVPIFINTTPQYLQDSLEKIALNLSPNVHFLPDEKRVALHVAAVFVNNFTNHLFHIGKTITDKNVLPFDTLIPLIEQTVFKIKNQDPKAVQTGPAIRGDVNTMEKHIAFLKDYPPQYLGLYELFSESISNKSMDNII
jgi:predicted short-subunit dehydrogenase-like oxidoreductase (DUF2520 family)